VRFLRFSQKRQDGSAPNFFSKFMRKHLFITICIEKQYTWPLRPDLHLTYIHRPNEIEYDLLLIICICC